MVLVAARVAGAVMAVVQTYSVEEVLSIQAEPVEQTVEEKLPFEGHLVAEEEGYWENQRADLDRLVAYALSIFSFATMVPL